MTILGYATRQAHWEWCREYIDRQCIWRTDSDNPPIPSKAPGGTYVWQFYLRRATFNSEFARRIGLLFWDRFLPIFNQRPFQIGACQPFRPADCRRDPDRSHAIGDNRQRVPDPQGAQELWNG
jgi:hypothetical protein